VSAQPEELPGARSRVSDNVARYLAAFGIFGGIVALFYYPGRIGPAAIVIALIAAGMASSTRRFAAIGMICASLGWFAGMVIAVLLERPIF
jgi:hypothetical protein